MFETTITPATDLERDALYGYAAAMCFARGEMPIRKTDGETCSLYAVNQWTGHELRVLLNVTTDGGLTDPQYEFSASFVRQTNGGIDIVIEPSSDCPLQFAGGIQSRGGHSIAASAARIAK